MILPPPKRPRSTEENILPLINIVFLLLIFFMLAGVLAQNPPFELKPPDSQQTEATTQLDNHVLAVAADGRIAFGGKTFDPIGDNSASDQALIDALADRSQDTPVQVRADGQLESARLTDLFATLQRAGIAEIDLLTRHRQP